ncbi:hypothetical protein Pth03_57720 [Planotetraspora thailandica]|uniref:Uncharacterized protein n=1 Tax=Planotetraspora thailandica TaxID=487172 RepID=A0A8J3V634_9ACTN|nr:hypothetical protein [Planotetraspora thailandica]GII57383.1 hypothetical protein Pth03_57720 [Planotetraspora thailandica]
MTSPLERDNLDLATSAQELADSAPAGSLRQAAAKSLAITLATTRDMTQARSALDGVAPDDVRQAALDLFDQLAGHA